MSLITRNTPDIGAMKEEADVEGLLEAARYSRYISEGARKAARSVRVDAIRALGELGGSDAEEGLINLNGPRSERMYSHIVRALIAIGTPTAQRAAAERLIPFVRANNPGEERASSLPYDDDHVYDWRVFARDKLREIGQPAVVILVSALDNEFLDPYQRAGAADILGAIGDPQALDALINASFDRDEIVSDAAQAALRRGSHQRHHLKLQLLKEGWGMQDSLHA